MTEAEDIRIGLVYRQVEALEKIGDNLCDLRGYAARVTVAVESLMVFHEDIHRICTVLEKPILEVINRSAATADSI